MATALLLFIVSLQCIDVCRTSSINNMPWSWDTVPLQSLFGTLGQTSFTDYQAEFIATNYKVVVLSDCLSHTRTVPVWYRMSSQLRKYAQTEQLKIFLYFKSDMISSACFNFTGALVADPTMHLHDINGNKIYPISGNTDWVLFDFNQSRVRKWWIDHLTTIIITAKQRYNVTVNGILTDGIFKPFSDAVYPNDVYKKNAALLAKEAQIALHSINDDTFLFACCIAPHGNNFIHVYPYLDGIMFEQYAGFGMVEQTGKINPDKMFKFFETAKLFGANKSKSLLVKAWIGPESTPFRTDNIIGPTWPDDYGQIPKTRYGIANVSAGLLPYPLATYLCGVYDQYIYFGYYYWYFLLGGVVPCPDDRSQCTAPVGWYKEFGNRLGKPLTDGYFYDKYKCNRSFEYAHVYVNVDDPTSAQIEWFTAEPTVDPTLSPTGVPTLTMEVMDHDTNTQSSVNALLVQIVVVVLLVIGCVSYFCYKKIKLKEDIDDRKARVYHEMS
eukprot:56503_1